MTGQPPKIVWQPLPGSQALALSCPCDDILYQGSRGPGKRIADTQSVLTDSGWKLVANVTKQDKLVAPDGTYTRILGIFPQATGTLYRMLFDDGAHLDVDDEHRWMAYDSKNQRWKVRTTQQLRASKNYTHIPLIDAPAPGSSWQGYDPYAIGIVIGDGTMTGAHPTVYTPEPEIRAHLEALGWRCYEYNYRSVFQMTLVGRAEAKAIVGAPQCKGDQKHVPKGLLLSDPTSRLAVLQGLMDSDGHCDKEGRCELTTVSYQLAQDVQYLVRSLGGKARVHKNTVSAHSGYGTRDYIYRVKITHAGKFQPFRLPRHVARLNPKQNGGRRRIVSIQPIADGAATCFSVAHESHQFVCQDFVVTHNTDAQVMKFRRYVGLGYGAFWRGIIFDREYKALDDLIGKSKRWFPQFGDGARFISGTGQLKWSWPSGEELWFRVLKNEDDYWKVHGQEAPFLGINELTKWPNLDLWDMVGSLNRTSFVPQLHSPNTDAPLPELPLIKFATANPYGPGHNAVKQRYIDPAPSGHPITTEREVYNPRTQQRETVRKTQVALFGSYRENTYLPPEYVAELESIRDPNKRRAWLLGDWNITSGGMFDDVWSAQHNIVEPFDVPHSWRIDRTFDWGSSAPFSVGWWAESDGSDVRLDDGTWRSTIKGDLYRIGEWYGWNGTPNKGLRMLSRQISKGIIDRELKAGWHRRVRPGPADNSINDLVNGQCIATQMAEPVTINNRKYNGATFSLSDKSVGSRKAGWEKMRDAIYNAQPSDSGFRELPGLFVFRTCQNGFIRTVPTLDRDDTDMDDVDTSAEDHCADEVRYRVLASGSRFGSGTTVGHS